MLTWAEYTAEVTSRLGVDSINPNAELQTLLSKSAIDGTINLQKLIPSLREKHVTEYSPSTGVRVLPDATQFNLPSGIRKVDEFYYKETATDSECPSWVEGFALDGFALNTDAEGYYQKTGAINPLEGIDTYEVGPTWFLNTENSLYGFRISKHADGNYYPALFALGGEDPLTDTETALPSNELYYLSNPLTEDTDEGPAYAPWLSDGVAVWKDAADDSVIVFPELALGTSFVRVASPLQYLPWVKFQNDSESLRWSSVRPGLDSFVVRGPFPSRHDRIVLHWTGVKQSFEDTDTVPFDISCALAVSYYVKSCLLAAHKDKRLHAKHYKDLWEEQRRSIYLERKDVGDTM